MKVSQRSSESSPTGPAPSPSSPGNMVAVHSLGVGGRGEKSCPDSLGGCYLIRASFPLAQICHIFPQENATLQIGGFGCFYSLGPKLGAAPNIPALGKGALSGDQPQDPGNPSCKTWLDSFLPCVGAERGQSAFAAAEPPARACGCSWRTRACRWSSCGRSWTPVGTSWTRRSARSATPSRYEAGGTGCPQIPITNPCRARRRACHHCQASGANSRPGSCHGAECGPPHRCHELGMSSALPLCWACDMVTSG